MSLERLGASDGFADFFLELLKLQGWHVVRRPAFGGGILVYCEREGQSFLVRGDDLAQAALAAFKAAALGAKQAA